MSAEPQAAALSSGDRGAPRGRRAVLADAAADARLALRLAGPRLRLAARRAPVRRVLVLSVERPGPESLLAPALEELRRSRHHLDIAVGTPGGLGKFENLNLLLEQHPAAGHDWLLVIDDDVVLPRGFLDAFLLLAERHALQLAQPAHRHTSHAAWPVTRRKAGAAARETAFVEIGPVTAIAAGLFGDLLPFPGLRSGWGLDLHWAGLAAQRGWKLGIVDAVPVLHPRPVGGAYAREEAIAEAQRFLAGRPYLEAKAAGRTLAVHRRIGWNGS